MSLTVVLALALLAAEAARVPAPEVGRVIESHSSRMTVDHVILVSPTEPYYSPGTLRLQVGESVVWRNDARADTTHSVVEIRSKAFALDLPVGGEARFTPAAPGEYVYRCRFHPWMTGKLTVEQRHLQVRWQTLPADIVGTRLQGSDAIGMLVSNDDDNRVFRITADSAPEPVATLPLRASAWTPTSGRIWLRLASSGRVVERHDGERALPGLPLATRMRKPERPVLAQDDRLWLRADGHDSWLGIDGNGDIQRAQGQGIMLAASVKGTWWLHDARLTYRHHDNGDAVRIQGPNVPGRAAHVAVQRDGLWIADGTALLHATSDGRSISLSLSSTGDEAMAVLAGDTGPVWVLLRSGTIARIAGVEINTYAAPLEAMTAHDFALDGHGQAWLLDREGHRIGRLRTP